MKIEGLIGAGFPRTGTLALKEALDELGVGPTYHMFSIFRERNGFWDMLRVMSLWIQIGNSKDKNLRQNLLKEALQHYNSFVDAPSFVYLEDLLEIYPNKKVILTERNSTIWYESANETVLKFAFSSPFKDFGIWFFLTFNPFGILLNQFHQESWVKKIFTTGSGRDNIIKSFENWHEKVRSIVPKERLIIYKIDEGWTPLIEALDVSKPNSPFPKTNDRKLFNDDSALSVSMNGWCTLLVYLICCLAALLFLRKKQTAENKKKKE